MKDIFLLDMDETLLDFRRTERENLILTLTECGIAPEEGTLSLFHEINDGLWKALERGEITRERLVIRRFELLFEALGEKPRNVEEVANAFFSRYLRLCHPFEGSLSFVKELASRGRVYIVTNGSALIQKAHIRAAGFEPYLSGTFISQEVGYDKPDLRFARAVAESIEGFVRSRAVWVGDSLTSDRLCAERAGIDFILYAPSGAPAGYAGVVARDYEEVLKALR